MSREEGKKIPHGAKPMSGERAALSGVAQDAVKCAAGAGQCALFPSNNPPKPHSRAFNPCRSNPESLAADCPNAILEKPRIHPQELCLDICCCRLALIAAPSRGPQTGLGPGFVWLQVRTQTPFSAWNGGQGGLEASSAAVRCRGPTGLRVLSKV